MIKLPKKILTLIALSMSLHAQAEKIFPEQDFPTTEVKVQRQNVFLNAAYSNLDSTTAQISGMSFGVGYQYGYSDRIGFQIHALQTTDLSTLGSVSTDYSASGVYTISGRLTHESRRINLNQVPLMQQKSLRSSAFAVRAGYTQTLFGGSTSIVSLPGFHFGLQYARPWSESVDLRLGLDYVSAKSGTRTVNQIQFGFGIAFWP